MNDIPRNDLVSRRTALGALSAFGVSAVCCSPGIPRTPDIANLADYIEDRDEDHSSALQRAINSGNGSVYIPEGTYIIDQVSGSNIRLFGKGKLVKKKNTKGVMLYLSGDNEIRDIVIDYNWPSANALAPYVNNISLYQHRGSLALKGVKFDRSFYAAVYIEGGSLSTDAQCHFSGAIPHNGLRGNAARLSHYIICVSDEKTDIQSISIIGGTFIGSSQEINSLHLNPTGVFITPSVIDGNQYKSVKIIGSKFIACSTNCGEGNLTGAIDIYNGAENIIIENVEVSLFSYAAFKIQNSSNFKIVNNSVRQGYIPDGAFARQSLGCATMQKVRGSRKEQHNGLITGNSFSNMYYAGIINDCNDVIIEKNNINDVKYEKLGSAINNSGNNVIIANNVGHAIAGIQIYSSGNNCTIKNNTMDGGSGSSMGAVYFSGENIHILSNTFISKLMSGGSGIRTNGNTSNFTIVDNIVRGFPYGIDIREGLGKSNKGKIEKNHVIGSVISVNYPSNNNNIFVSNK